MNNTSIRESHITDHRVAVQAIYFPGLWCYIEFSVMYTYASQSPCMDMHSHYA